METQELAASVEVTTEEVMVTEPAALSERRIAWAGISTGDAGDRVMTSQELLTEAGLDWEVGIRPLKRQLSNGTIVDSSRFETYRMDSEDEPELGTVKSRYELLQNREAFDFGDSVVADGAARWTKAGLQLGGARVFMSMILHNEWMILGRDPFQVHLFLSSSHDGSRSLSGRVTPIRVFCTNQINAINASALEKFDIQHTSRMQQKMADAASMLQLSGEYMNVLKADAERLAAVRVTDDKARYLITSLIPERRGRRDDMIEEIMMNYRTSPTVGEFLGTGYGLLNGLTEYMDHLKPSQNGNARYESITFGEGARYRRKLSQALAELN
jgi:phage/plasmid-like protein (TIGR03299 family)